VSTRIMAACWPLQMPPVAKAVLISLADNANDAGHCWPSIETICERTCYGRTAVIDAIKWLEDNGHLSADRSNGRKTSYQLHPIDTAKPVRHADRSAARTGSPDGLNQSATRTKPVRQADTNRQEPSITVKKEDARARAVVRPAGVAESTWQDFLQLRKAKKAPLTPTALDGICRESEKAGLTLGEALSVCCERGWQSFRADWHQQQPRASPRRSAAVEAGLALAGYTRRTNPVEVFDVTPTVAGVLG